MMGHLYWETQPVAAKYPRGPSETLKEVTFEISQLMSTFMFGFVIGDFDFMESKSKEGVILRVFAPPTWKKHGRFALEVAVKVMDFMHDFIRQPFPLSKVDFVAVKETSTGVVQL
jgi:puromycin-sensitive aminopeptidase